MSFDYLEYCTGDAPTHAVVLLHGWGSNAQDMASLASEIGSKKIKFLCPNAPHPHPYSDEGRMWYDLETQAHLSQVRTDLHDWVRSLPERIKIPIQHIILGGFSQGGAMTLDVGHDLGLGGLICLSGYLHPSIQFSPRLKKPALIIHGSNDTVVPIQAARIIETTMRQADWIPESHELPMAHTVSTQALELIQAFLGRICRN